MIFVRNGSLVISAHRRNATYFIGGIWSKEAYTPSDHKDMRREK